MLRTRIGTRNKKNSSFWTENQVETTVADIVRIKAALFIIASALCSGCGTVMTGVDPNPYPVYGGVRQDARVIGVGGQGAILLIDIPLSFAADTLLLPVGLCNLTLLPPSVDPLKGWSGWNPWDEEPGEVYDRKTHTWAKALPPKHPPLDKIIKDDYKNYLTQHEPGYFGSGTSFYEDGTGQHAVKIQVGRDGRYTVYIFKYDKNNVRVKIIRYANGGYAC